MSRRVKQPILAIGDSGVNVFADTNRRDDVVLALQHQGPRLNARQVPAIVGKESCFRELASGEIYVYVAGWERGSAEFRKLADDDW